MASARGYRTLILIPETQSQEKKDMLRLCGAELIEVPALPFSNPNNYQHVGKTAGRPACARPSRTACCSPTNGTISTTPRRITNSTGPEIWQQTGGKVDGFICSVGTGGTLAGTSRYLKEKNKDIVDRLRRSAWRRRCMNCSSTAKPNRRRANRSPKASGLAASRPIIETAKVDDAFLIPDEEAVTVIYELLEHEGLCLGGSTGINVAGAIRLAKQLGPGHTIVTILCDSGNRYQSKLFNPDFMRSKNLPVPEWLEKRSKIDLPFEKV